jgi:hypothetical protein
MAGASFVVLKPANPRFVIPDLLFSHLAALQSLADA